MNPAIFAVGPDGTVAYDPWFEIKNRPPTDPELGIDTK
jgi:hypothetical protein